MTTTTTKTETHLLFSLSTFAASLDLMEAIKRCAVLDPEQERELQASICELMERAAMDALTLGSITMEVEADG